MTHDPQDAQEKPTPEHLRLPPDAGALSGVFVWNSAERITEVNHPHASIWLEVLGHPPTDQCPVPECMACGMRDCPDQEPLHYHHDGCPCCAQIPARPADAAADLTALRASHARLRAELRGWQDFFSGQPYELPYRGGSEEEAHESQSVLNVAWALGYERAKASDLFTLMVGRADRGSEAKNELEQLRASVRAVVEEMRRKAQADRARQYNKLAWACAALEVERWAERLAALAPASDVLIEQRTDEKKAPA